MTPKTALQVLGLPIGSTPSETEVREAAAALLRRVHPDTSDFTDSEAAKLIKKYKMARDVLIEEAKRRDGSEECGLCGGTGQMKTRSGALIKCARCAGDGVVRRKEIKRG